MPKLTAPNKLMVLDGLGYVLFAVGAFYALATHGVHDRIAPFLADRFPHWVEVAVGAAAALVGIAILVSSDKLKRRRKEAESKVQA